MRAVARQEAPASPILLEHKFKSFREEFAARAWEREEANSSAISFSANSKQVREEFAVKAWQRQEAPASPILLLDKSSPRIVWDEFAVRALKR